MLVVSYGAEIVALLVRKETLLLFVVATCCLGLTLLDTCVADPADGVVDGDATDVDVVVGDEGDEEEVVVFFTVFGILHMRASVVLTTFRPGLPGLHSSALSLADIVVVVLDELEGGDDGVGVVGDFDAVVPVAAVPVDVAGICGFIVLP